MKFGPTPLDEAEGAVLAHTIRLQGGAIKKGVRLTREHVEGLREAGLQNVTAARLEPDDIAEDAAAAQVAAALAPDPSAAGLRVAAAFTGRVNLYAEAPGVLLADQDRIAAANRVDEAVTVATLAHHARIAARQMAATVKIIPYAAAGRAVAAVAEILSGAAPALRIAPFARRTAGLALTRTRGMAEKLLDKGEAAIRARCRALGVELVDCRRVDHDVAALAEALGGLQGEMLLILGASATSDRRDVAPAAIAAAGGVVERLGMPVDPGNLLVLGRLGERPALGLPGCARSPKLNGADWVLERLTAGLPVTSGDIAAMGVGGLLMEIPSRPEPRLGAGAVEHRRPRVSALLLAAGGSTRMGGRNKLLELVDGAPLVRRSAERLLASGADEVVAVLGAENDAMRAALAGTPARLIENPSWREGVASSIRAGLAAISPRADAALIALADMPEVDAALVDRLIAGFDPAEGREIVRPVAVGRAGHPVLFGRRFFEALAQLEGDVGARAVVAEHGDYLVEISVEGGAPLRDLDTPEDWARWRGEQSDAG